MVQEADRSEGGQGANQPGEEHEPQIVLVHEAAIYRQHSLKLHPVHARGDTNRQSAA
jgi:hypothetical protein